MGEKKRGEGAAVKPEHKPSKGFHWFAYVVLPLSVALVSIFGTYWLTQYSNRLRTFRYTVNTSSGLFQRPDFGGAEIKVLVGDKQIDNVSTVSVRVYNTSDQDFEDVPIRVTLTAKGGGKPVVLAKKVPYPPDADAPLSSPTTQPVPSPGVSFEYRVKVANRGDQSVFGIDYMIEGREAPDVEVKAVKKGLEFQKRDDDSGKKSEPTSWAMYVSPMVLLVAGAIFFWTQIRDQRREREQRSAEWERALEERYIRWAMMERERERERERQEDRGSQELATKAS